MPLAKAGIQDFPAGFLVAGLSPRLEFDKEYRDFIELAAGHIATAIANARTLEEERKRAASLAELDRAKTEFFSNVSHEFRTPLTLMLGNLEEVLAKDGQIPEPEKEQIETAHRNSLRLLKLVNTLLDFSRIEANRQQADFVPTDLAKFTAELASNFRSAIEKAGIKLTVDCPPLSQEISVDCEIWEKIVLNLVSNAFKYTFEGEIKIALSEDETNAVLEISDTGTGISEENLPHIFERFHRVSNAKSRTHECTGIGLALVKELVKLHDGAISATSEIDKGTTFTVSIPIGAQASPLAMSAKREKVFADLEVEESDAPFSRPKPTLIASGDACAPVNKSIAAYLNELEATESNYISPSPLLPVSSSATILLADDNADMREYVRRLLEQNGYRVSAVPSGAAALEILAESKPDLILSDVMMPFLDGFGLLEKVRETEETREIPVILLSARAGEEAKVEGLEAGADDYLIKPFSAKELIARVDANMKLARLRRETAERLRESQANLQRYRLLSEKASDVIWLIRPDGKIVEVNGAATKIYGYSREELLQMNVRDLREKSTLPLVDAQLKQANEIGLHFETVHVRKDGAAFPVEINATGGDFGGERFLLSIVRDVSERKRAEENLRESEARYRGIVNQTVAGIAETDLTGKFITVNDRLCEIVGYTRSKLLEKRMQDITHKDDLPANLEKFKRLAETGASFEIEKRYTRQDGRAIWVHNYVSAVCDALGKPQSIVAAVSDVTTRKEAEEKLNAAHRRLENVLKSISDGLLMLDKNWIYTYFSERGAHLIGMKSEDLVGKCVWDLFPHAEGTKFYEMYHLAVESGQPVQFEEYYPAPLDQWLECHCYPSGEGLSVYFHDVTDRKRTELNAILLAEIGQDLTFLADEREIIKVCGEKIGEYFGCDQCVFAEFDAQADTATALYSWRKDETTFDATGIYRMKDFVTREIQALLTAGKPVVVNDVAADSRIHNKKAHQEFGIASAVNTPFVSEGLLKAAVGLNCKDVRDWRADEIELLQELTRRIWTRIERERAEQAVRTRNRQLDLLARTSQMLITGEQRGETETLQIVFAEFADALDTEFFFNFLVTEDGAETLRLATSGGLSDGQKDFFATIRFGEYLCGTVAQKREKLVVENLQECEYAEAAALCSAGVKCYAGFPLLAHGKLLGTIAFATRSRTHFRPGELQIIQTVCDQTATTLARHRAEEAMRESEEKFRNLANSMSQFAWIADAAGYIFWYNERWFEYTGTTLEQMQGWGWKAVHHPDEVERVVEKISRCFATGEIWEDTFPLKSKTGEFRWFLSRALPIRNERGEVVRWFGTNTDVEEIRQARLQAENANRLKDEFLATVSHELRTPLNAILGWASLLQSGKATEEIRQRADETIYRSAKSQAQLIEDLLDVSRIITGKMRLEPRPVQLAALVESAIHTLRPAADAKSIRLDANLECEPCIVNGDAQRLQQIVWNLISNAVKFTTDGGRVEVKLEADSSHVCLIVSDTGKGIEPEFLPFMFERFSQEDGSTTRRHGGLGLGLAIVRHLVELHGGKISAASAGANSGSTFTVELPLLSPVVQDEKSPDGKAKNLRESLSDGFSAEGNNAPKQLNGIRVLLVDDELDTLELLDAALTAEGADVRVASSAADAFEIFQRWKPDVIVSDIAMPDEDGYSLIAKIRALAPDAGGRAPAIAMTAYVRVEDRMRVLKSGFQMYVPKPAEPFELTTAINNLVKKSLS